MFWIVVALSVNPFSWCVCRSPLDQQREKLNDNIGKLLKNRNYEEIKDLKIKTKFLNLYKNALALVPKAEEESGCFFLEQTSKLALLGVANNQLELLKLVFQFGYAVQDLTGYFEKEIPNKISLRQLEYILNDKDFFIFEPVFKLDKSVASRFVELCLTSPFNSYNIALDYIHLVRPSSIPDILELQIRLRLIYGNIPDDKLVDKFATYYQLLKWAKNDISIIRIAPYKMSESDSQATLLLADLMLSNEAVNDEICDFVVIATLPGKNCLLFNYLSEREYCKELCFTKAKKLSMEWYGSLFC